MSSASPTAGHSQIIANVGLENYIAVLYDFSWAGCVVLTARISCEFTHIVEKLLDSGANIDAVDINGKTALHLAMSRSTTRSTNSHINVVKLLLDRGANVNIVTSMHAETNGGKTAMQIAEKRNLCEIVQLIKKIKEINRTAPLIAARPPAHTRQSGPQVTVFRQDGLFDNIKSFIPYADA